MRNGKEECVLIWHSGEPTSQKRDELAPDSYAPSQDDPALRFAPTRASLQAAHFQSRGSAAQTGLFSIRIGLAIKPRAGRAFPFCAEGAAA